MRDFAATDVDFIFYDRMIDYHPVMVQVDTAMEGYMKIKFLAAIGVSITLLTGCVSSGNQTLREENQETVGAKIIEGRTSKSEIQQHFGAPISTTFNDNAEEIWTYSLSNMKAGPENFIPYVGMLGGTASGTEKRLVILFNRNDIVKRYSMTESNVEARTGIFNQ